jgi:hypothetical protein
MSFPVIEDGIGAIPTVQPITLDPEGRISAPQAKSLLDVFRGIVAAVNGHLSLGSGITGHRAGNLDAQYIDFLCPAIRDTEFIVPHGLGRVPVGYVVVRIDRAANVYDSSVGSWSPTLLYLKCDTASASIRLMVW